MAVRVIVQGAIPVRLFVALSSAFSRYCKDAVALDGSHAFSKAHGATVCFVAPNDEVVNGVGGSPGEQEGRSNLG